ncbi:ParB N-terminal domain-containing protein [Aminobacter sp. Piv2-1]|uniref:ParB N-terminal domain-containing protein n=1 Tax=Aminobacter sp. Piv2-1 TaxID=3031122 RepID=UPI0030A87A3E
MAFDLKKINVDELDLDPKNPRLPTYVERDQPSMLEFLARSSAIEELMSAISENDFFEAEALIAVPENGRLVVVEGNRRLTALKLLRGASYPDISTRILSLQENATHRPSAVPVAIYDSRKEVLNYLGNRHIAGVKPWGALAKARYIKQLMERTPDDMSFAEKTRSVAKVIGSRRDFISKSMKAYDVYEVAEKENFFDLRSLDERSVKFSLITTAIDYEGIQHFLFDGANSSDDSDNKEPISERVKEFFSWLFVKDKDGRVRVGESRNLHKLSQIMLNDDALRAFRSGATIEQAYIYTKGINEDFDMLCIELQRSLREANSLVADVEKNEPREELINSIFRQARQLEASFRG